MAVSDFFRSPMLFAGSLVIVLNILFFTSGRITTSDQLIDICIICGEMSWTLLLYAWTFSFLVNIWGCDKEYLWADMSLLMRRFINTLMSISDCWPIRSLFWYFCKFCILLLSYDLIQLNHGKMFFFIHLMLVLSIHWPDPWKSKHQKLA